MTTVDEPVALDGIGMVPMTAPAQTGTPEVEIDAKYLDLLRELGFTEIPTADQVKAKLDERRAVTRNTVLAQADEGSWCESGTRQVCANLRLPRPGERTEHDIDVDIHLVATFRVHTFTPESALAHMQRHYLTEANLSRLNGVRGIRDVNFSIIEKGTPDD